MAAVFSVAEPFPGVPKSPVWAFSRSTCRKWRPILFCCEELSEWNWITFLHSTSRPHKRTIIRIRLFFKWERLICSVDSKSRISANQALSNSALKNSFTRAREKSMTSLCHDIICWWAREHGDVEFYFGKLSIEESLKFCSTVIKQQEPKLFQCCCS